MMVGAFRGKEVEGGIEGLGSGGGGSGGGRGVAKWWVFKRAEADVGFELVHNSWSHSELFVKYLWKVYNKAPISYLY